MHTKLNAIVLEQSRRNRELVAAAAAKQTSTVQPVNYLRVREVAGIHVRAHCGNCHGENDLTHYVQLGWLLCGNCRKLYVQALRDLTPSGRIARRYQPIGAYAPVEYEDGQV